MEQASAQACKVEGLLAIFTQASRQLKLGASGLRVQARTMSWWHPQPGAAASSALSNCSQVAARSN